MIARRVSTAAWMSALLVFAGGIGLTFGHAAGTAPGLSTAAQGPRGRGGAKLEPPAIKSSKLRVRVDWVGRVASGNLNSPVVAGNSLIFVTQTGSLDAWDGTNTYSLLTPANSPAGVAPFGPEAIQNVAVNSGGTRVYVMFTSSTVPDSIPQRPSPRLGADAWHVLYGFDFDGTALSNAAPITALQVRSDGHTGGGLTMAGEGTLIFATGDNGDSGEDGREYAQSAANHLGKLVRIDLSTGATAIASVGMRNVQRLIVDSSTGTVHVIAADIGGLVAEEVDVFPLAGLLTDAVRNGGWGRNAVDGRAREGTFYIDANGVPTAAAPVPEAGFVQPIAQFGREGAELVAITGPVSSAVSFQKIRLLFGDLVSGSVYALTSAPTTSSQVVYRVALVDNASRATTLKALASGARPDPRFFSFPDGSAGVLLEATGDFYRITEVR